METLIKDIEISFREFLIDAKLRSNKGNQAAGRRSRKASLGIDKLLKDWREKSVKEDK